MEGIKIAACLICCFLLMKVTFTAPIGTTDERMQELEARVEELTEKLKSLEEESIHHAKRQAASSQGAVLNENKVPKRSCKEIYDDDNTVDSGLYKTAPTDNKGEFTVFCDMSRQSGGGWTVIQRRVGNTTDFYREWQEYKTGFGEMDGSFWLGLEKIHRITQIENHELLVTMVDHDNKIFTAKYDLFKVDSSATDYQLDLGSYVSAGSNARDSLSIHNNQKFTTSDRDNDKRTTQNCAVQFHGAWWYNDCYQTNLNGRYYYGNYGNYNNNDPTAVEDGIVWRTATGFWHSLKSVTMAIRPISKVQ